MCPNTKGCHESFTGHPDGEIMSPGPKATQNTNSSTVPYQDVTTALLVGEKNHVHTHARAQGIRTTLNVVVKIPKNKIKPTWDKPQ